MEGFAFITIKTTGIRPVLEKIFHISITTFDPNMRARLSYSTYLNPEKNLSERQEKFHGITNDELKEYPTFQGVCDIVYKMIKNRHLGTFSKSRVDTLSFLIEELFYADIDFSYKARDFIYVTDIEDKIFERNVDNLLTKYTGVPRFKHDYETRRIGEVFKHQCRFLDVDTKDFKYSDIVSLEETFFERQFIEDEEGFIVLNFGKHKGTRLVEVKDEYLEWMLESDFPLSIKERIKKHLWET